MQTTVINNIKGSDIPPVWLKKTNQKPENIFKVTIEVVQVKQTKKVKWTKMLNDFKKNPLDQEAKQLLKTASKSFKEDFDFREPPHFTT